MTTLPITTERTTTLVAPFRPNMRMGAVAIDRPNALPFSAELVSGNSSALKSASIADALAAVKQLATSTGQMYALTRNADGAFFAVQSLVMYSTGTHLPPPPPSSTFKDTNGITGIDRRMHKSLLALVGEDGRVFDVSAAGKFPLEPAATAGLRRASLAAITVDRPDGAKQVRWGGSSESYGTVGTHFRLLGSTFEQAEAAARELVRRPSANVSAGSMAIVKGTDGAYYGTVLTDKERELRLNLDVPAGWDTSWSKLTVKRSNPALQALVGARQTLRFSDGNDTATLTPSSAKH